LLSRKKQEVHQYKRPALTAQYQAVQSGRWLVEQYNCHGCHYFDHAGGRFAQYWSLDAEGRSVFKGAPTKKVAFDDFDFQAHIEGPVRGHTPPQLLDQGNKTRSDWLFSFLLDPSQRLRPQLKMRMPTFQLADDEANRLNAMFAGIEGQLLGAETSFEPDPQLANLGQELFTRGQCTRCHMFSDTDPKDVPASVVAPNLKLVAGRLQHTWTPRWLADPQSIMPGANMPNYFDLKSGMTTLDTETKLLDQDRDGKLSEAELRRGMEALNHHLIRAGRTYKPPQVVRGPQTASR
jgi:hypothetical protein